MHANVPTSCNNTVNICGSGTGVTGADLLLYVTVKNSTTGCSKYDTATDVAFAVACWWDDVTSRPTVAALNFCPDSVFKPNTTTQQRITYVVHEMIHALVSDG